MDIRRQKLESMLQEVLSEALSQLNNTHINALSITGVKCSRGKQSAEVYIEGTDIAEENRGEILSQLKKAQGILREYVLNSTQWFRCPALSFKFDDTLQSVNNLDSIFAKIAQEGTQNK